MDIRGDSIKPRRALHSSAWHFTPFANTNDPSYLRQMASAQPGSVHPVQHPELATINQSQRLYVGVDKFDKSYKCPQEASYGNPKTKNNLEEKPNKCKKMLLMCYTAIDEYFNTTTLHGLKYVGDNTLSALERLYWFALFICGLCLACYFIANIYSKYETSPMVISFNPKLMYLREIPFPALTICNVNLVLRSKAKEIERNGDPISRELLADACHSQTGDADEYSDELSNATNWETMQKFTIDVNQKCDDLVKVCKWNGKVQNCDKLINSVLTDEGYCCAFNQLPLNMTLRGNFTDRGHFPENIINWHAEYGYGNAKDGTYPYWAAGRGQELGLTLVLDAQLHEYHCTSTNSIGFKMLLAAPNERPNVADIGFLMSPGFESRTTIYPKVQDATEGVRNIHVEKRQCYFATERRLKYYLAYTERNCRLECMSNFTLVQCECIPYYLPRDYNEKICGRAQENCTLQVKDLVSRYSDERLQCRCLPSCHDITYKVDSTSLGSIESKYETVNSDIIGNVSSKYFSENMAVAHFYFESDKYHKQTKSEMYGFSEFLSNTGGLLGLFLGFSFLSAIEIVYFILLRWPFRYYRQYKARKLKEKGQAKRWANLPYVQ